MSVEHQVVAQERSALWKKVFILAWPAIIEMSLQMTVGIVDTIMVGRLGKEALASVGLANQINWFATTVFAAVSTGSTALVARHIGAREPKEAGDVARQSIFMGIVLAGSVMAILLLFGQNILHLLFKNSEPEVLSLSTGYVKIVSAAVIMNFFLMITNAVLRGAGNTRTPMLVTMTVNILNLVGNYFFIYGNGPFPAMGVNGAALGTTLAQVVGGIIALVVLLRSPLLSVNLKGPYRFDKKIIKRILTIGLPAAFEQGTMRIGQLLYTMIVASLGTVSYAAHQVAINAESLSYMPGWGFALAATTLVGQSLGANDPDLAEKSGNISARMAFVVMSIMGALFFLFPYQIVALFTSDPEVIDLAAVCLRLVAIAQPPLAFLQTYSGGLRGAGDTKTIMKITTMGFLGLRITLAYLLAITFKLGLVGAWIAMVVDLVTRSGLMWITFRRGKWKLLKV
ncbi:MAG: MATE family efflux transporter [Firmicutes bacterium]|nr:MATE family efflux transporter [Bacillota bacterium]